MLDRLVAEYRDALAQRDRRAEESSAGVHQAAGSIKPAAR
jgi:hypothetical protein